MTDYTLQTHGLTKQFGDNTAVNHVDMTIEKGDIYGFIGRNGAGKTTFLRMITGLVEPTAGDIQLFSRDNRQTNLSRIGSIIESPALYPDFSATQNMEVRRKLLGIPDKDKIQEILAIVDLADTGKKKVKHFSLGMKQRLGVALALLGNPDFLILDEPTNGLDPEGIVAMRRLLKKLNEDRNLTLLISSHILGELAKMATRYGIINDGTLVEEFIAEELEQRCRRYLHLQVSDVKKAAFVLETAFDTTNYDVLPDNELKIYDHLDMSAEIVLAFATHDVKVYRIASKGEDLEGYFMKRMGATANA